MIFLLQVYLQVLLILIDYLKNQFLFAGYPMNITLANSSFKPTGLIRQPTCTPPHVLPRTPHKDADYNPSPHTCGTFFFSHCVEQQQIGNSQQNEVYQQNRLIQRSNSQAAQQGQQKLRSGDVKRKISLSLCNSESNFRTPKKRSVQISTNINSQSRNKRFKTHTGHQQKPPNYKIELSSIDNRVRVNSSQKKPNSVINVHKMRESIKPLTNIPTTPNNSAKKSMGLPLKKPKLSLSSSFKSQIQAENFQLKESLRSNQQVRLNCQGTGPNIYKNQRQMIKNSSQEVIDDSFMTAKLANIYGEINASSQSKAPQSNIVFYNRIMAKEQWKNKEAVLQANRQREQIKVEEQAPWNISQKSSSFPKQSSSDLDEQQPQFYPYIQTKVPLNPKERRWIGDYAPTIKTFNNSESKSDHESVVIGRGPQLGQHAFPPITFQRGSVKDYYKEPGSQQIKRACTSFGGDEGGSTEQEGKDRLREWLSHPIEEDISEKDY